MLERRQYDARDRLRFLDACLQHLEEAQEGGETVVSDEVAAKFGDGMRAIVSGIATSRAINLVLREQEQHLSAAIVATASDGYVVEPLDETGARDLTEQIRTTTRRVCLLLLEAHRRRAWLALGYSTWEQYIQREFGLSRSRSYELLDQGRTIRALMAAAGVSGVPDISANAARHIKEHLPEIIKEVRERCAGASELQALQVVVAVVDQQRARLGEERPQVVETRTLPGAAVTGDRTKLARLCEVIDRLTAMPPASEVVSRIPDDLAHRLGGLDSAARWLAEFNEEWRRRQEPERPKQTIVRDEVPDGGAAGVLVMERTVG